jgi:hypothetical protein
MKTFKKAFPNAQLKVESYKVTRWYDDPFALGAYSHRGPFVKNSVESG